MIRNSQTQDLQRAVDLSPQVDRSAVRAPLLCIYSSVRSVRSADAAVESTPRPASYTHARPD